tara:strand:- start:3719 stop:4399 length:681 start_codon:yes stop_codon:yes gene_type:complete
MKRLLLVDSDDESVSALIVQLEFDREYIVESVAGYEELAKITKEKKIFDLILVNIQNNAYRVGEIRKIKDHFVRVGLIALVPKDYHFEGVLPKLDHYNEILSKPIKVSDLLASISRNVTLKIHDDQDLKIANYFFRPDEKILIDIETKDRIRLTEKETDILRQLHRADQNELSRRELLRDIWGYKEGIYSHTLETHIYRLRKKIEKNPSDATILITTESGYRLTLC